MLDTNTLSLEFWSFAYPKTGVSRHHIADCFATIAWFHALKIGAEATTVADVMRFYELTPKASRPTEIWAPSTEWRHKQWTERAKGVRKPNKRIIEAADERCADSARIFDMALWPALRTDRDLRKSFLEASNRMPESEKTEFESQAKMLMPHATMRYIKTLKQRGTLDDLACLLLLLRQANCTSEFHMATALSKCVNRVLLLQAGWLCMHGLLNPIVEYINKEFFMKVPSPGGSVSACTYFQQLQCLTKSLSHCLPRINNEIDIELWHHGVDLVLTDIESL